MSATWDDEESLSAWLSGEQKTVGKSWEKGALDHVLRRWSLYRDVESRTWIPTISLTISCCSLSPIQRPLQILRYQLACFSSSPRIAQAVLPSAPAR